MYCFGLSSTFIGLLFRQVTSVSYVLGTRIHAPLVEVYAGH